MTYFVFIDESGKSSDIEVALREDAEAKYILASIMLHETYIKEYTDLVKKFVEDRVAPLVGTTDIEIHGNEILSARRKGSPWDKIPLDEKIRIFKDLFSDVIAQMNEITIHIVGMHSSAVLYHTKEFSLEPATKQYPCKDFFDKLYGRGLFRFISIPHRRKKSLKRDFYHCIDTSLMRILLERIQYSFQKKIVGDLPVVLVLDSHPNEDSNNKSKIRMPASEEDLRMIAALEDAREKSSRRGRWSGPLYASIKSSRDEPLLQIVDVIAYVVNRIENSRPILKSVNEVVDFWEIFDYFIKPKIRKCPPDPHYCSDFCECGYKFTPREYSEVYKRDCKACLSRYGH